MRKHLLRMFVTMLCLAVMNAIAARQQFAAADASDQYPECIYILGSDGVWNPSQPSATLAQKADEPGAYEGDVVFSGQYFALGGSLGTSEYDWTTFNANRYAPEMPDQVIPLGETQKLYKAADRSFMVLVKGECHVAVNLNDMTIRLSAIMPGQFYIVDYGPGDTPDYANPTVTLLPTEPGSGIYKGSATLTGSAFALGTKLGDYDTFFANNYSLDAANQRVRINRHNYLGPSPYAILLDDPGTYDVTVDLNAMTLELDREGYVPAYPYDLKIGTADGLSFTYLIETEVPHVYSGFTYFGDNAYTITSATKNVSLALDGKLNANATTPISVGDHEPTPFRVDTSLGDYYQAWVTVDLDNERIILFANDDAYPGDSYPNELYVIGNAQGWYTKMPTCVLGKTDKEGIYEGKAWLDSYGFFGILQRLGPTWDYVNQTRLVPMNNGDEILLGEPTRYVYDPSEYNDGAWMFTGESGFYAITVDMLQKTVTVSDPTTVGINAPVSAPDGAQQPMYDLSGRRVGDGKPMPGIYVRQGRKVVVK